MVTLLGGCSREPDAPDVLAQAALAAERGSPREAADILEEFEERKPGNPEVIEQLAFYHTQLGDPLMASMYFVRLAELHPDDPSFLLYAVQSLVEAGDTNGALLGYERYLQVRPQDTGVWIALGDLAARSGQVETAIGAYSRAMEQRPSGQPALRLGQLYFSRGNPALAEQWFAAALQLDGPHVPEVLLGQAELALRQNQPEAAEAIVRRLQADFPGVIEESRLKDVPAQLAAWRARQEEARIAMEALRAQQQAQAAAEAEAARIAAEQAAIESATGDTEVGPGRLDDKEEAVVRVERQQARQQQPPPGSTLALARQARERGDVEEAARLYRRALGERVSAELWNEYSVFSMEIGQPQQAFAASLEAMRLDPQSLPYAMQYLNVAQEVQSPPRFLQELVQMRDRFPASPDLTLALARAYWRISNNSRNARLLYDEFQQMAPAHPQAAQARAERAQLPE